MPIMNIANQAELDEKTELAAANAHSHMPTGAKASHKDRTDNRFQTSKTGITAATIDSFWLSLQLGPLNKAIVWSDFTFS